MGFKISQEFPSRFLSGDEINGSVVPVTIREAKKETVNAGTKDEEQVLVIYFEGKDRGVRLNKTRSNEIKSALGGLDDTDQWVGQRVALYSEKMKAFGEWHNVLHFKASDELPAIQADEEAVDVANVPF